MSGRMVTVFEEPRNRLRHDRTALSLTLELLFDRYTSEARYLPDGSPKTETYLQHVHQTGRYLARFFGRRQLVSELTPDRVHDYVVWRRSGGVSHRGVGANTIQRDLGMFKAALNWACQKYEEATLCLLATRSRRYASPRRRTPSDRFWKWSLSERCSPQLGPCIRYCVR